MAELKILERDRTGKCTIGECRDRIKELEDELQVEMGKYDVKEPEDYPSLKWAENRNEPPGYLGGHV